LAFRTDPTVLDGRFANNGWLQELPKPITKLTWDNAILVSPATASKLKATSRPAFTGGEHGTIDSDVAEITIDGRKVRGAIFAVTRDEYARDPRSMREGDDTPPRIITLYPEYEYTGYKWGMAIDINACIGCNACIVGCQAENNIPVVGKAEVLRGREMHWLRV